MTASLPDEVQQVFQRFVTTEYTTVDKRGQPIAWPVTPYYRPGDPCIDVSTGMGYPKKADDAARNPKVALLFSDPTGSALEGAPMVLVQGTADVDERNLDANKERYIREGTEKGVNALFPPNFPFGMSDWYFKRIYVHVRPERIYVWPDSDAASEPTLYDSHLEEVRSGHAEEPPAELAPPDEGRAVWDARIEELCHRFALGVLALVAPDGFPFTVRVPIAAHSALERIHITEPVGAPLQPGLACLTVHAHDDDFTWQQNMQVRGDLVNEDGAWSLIPHKLVGGFQAPPGRIALYRENIGKVMRMQRKARSRRSGS
jgi:hypothetical protein